jgi:hypothetical protein
MKCKYCGSDMRKIIEHTSEGKIIIFKCNKKRCKGQLQVTPKTSKFIIPTFKNRFHHQY